MPELGMRWPPKADGVLMPLTDARIGHEVAAEGGRSPDATEVFLSAMNFLRGYHMAGPGLLMFRPIFRTFCLYMFSV